MNDLVRMAMLYDAGWTLREIAAEMHYGHVTVRKRLCEAGVQLRPRGQRHGTTRLPHREITRTVLARQLCSLERTATIVGHSPAATSERLARAGAR